MSGEDPKVTHDDRDGSDVNTRAILLSGAVLVAAGIVIYLAAGLMLLYFDRSAGGSAATSETRAATENQAPEPRLQTNPAADLAAIRAAEERTLASYGIIGYDGDVPHLRIPIERAIDLVVERGLAGNGTPATSPAR